MSLHSDGTEGGARINGKFAPGHSGNPGGRLRKLKKSDVMVLDAINTVMTREETEALLRDALAWCRKHSSVKGAVSLLQLTLGYQLGTPVKRIVSARMKVEDILGSVTDLEDDAFEQAIDVLYTSNEAVAQ